MVVEDSGLMFRFVEPTDIGKGYFDLLAQLTVAPAPTTEEFEERLNLMRAHDMHTIVIEDVARQLVVGTVTLLVEPKLIRGLAFVGHIEDVAVHKEFQGRRLGQKLIARACALARDRRCYKVILDADEKNGVFYEKCGFFKKETQYRMDIL